MHTHAVSGRRLKSLTLRRSEQASRWFKSDADWMSVEWRHVNNRETSFEVVKFCFERATKQGLLSDTSHQGLGLQGRLCLFRCGGDGHQQSDNRLDGSWVQRLG